MQGQLPLESPSLAGTLGLKMYGEGRVGNTVGFWALLSAGSVAPWSLPPDQGCREVASCTLPGNCRCGKCTEVGLLFLGAGFSSLSV